MNATRIDATLVIFEFMDLKINHIIAQNSVYPTLRRGVNVFVAISLSFREGKEVRCGGGGDGGGGSKD